MKVKQIEELAAQSFDFQSLFEAVPGYYLVVDGDPPDFPVKAISKSFLEVLGQVGAQVSGESVETVLPRDPDHPSHQAFKALRDSIEDACKTGKPVGRSKIPFEFVQNGKIQKRYWNLVTSPLGSNAIETTQILLSVADTTDLISQKETAERLARLAKDSERQFETLVRLLPDVVFRLDTDLRHLYISPAVERLTGKPAEDWLGKTAREMGVAPSFCDIYDVKYRKAIKTAKPTEVEVFGHGRHYRTRIIPELRGDKVVSLMGITEDVTDQHNAKRDLEHSEERYKSFVAQSSEGIWRFELDEPMDVTMPIEKQIDWVYEHAYLAECNDRMAQMYGFQVASDITGTRLPNFLVREDQKNIDYLTSFFQSGYRLTNVESSELDKDGNPVYFLNSLIGQLDDGRLLRAWGVQQDITDRVRLDRQKDEFIGIASHELKTPVTGLKAYTQVLHQRFIKNKDDRSAAMLQKMDLQLDRLTNLINDLLDVTKMEGGKLQIKMEDFELNPLVQEVTEDMQRTTSDHKLILKLGRNCTVKGNRDRINQVLTNLISNAVKYSPKADKVIITTRLSGKAVQIDVQDFGIGLSAQEQQHVFERFYRGQGADVETYPGLGLGLFISSEIIKRHKGNITLRSTPGQGTTFTVSLPVKKSAATGQPTPRPKQATRPKTPKPRQASTAK